MEVILLERIEKLGQMGDVVRVKPGYARNFLLPKGKALRASEANVEYFENRKSQLEAENLKRRNEADAVAKRMEGLSVVLVRQAAESGQLYGSVSTRDIAEAISAAGYTVQRGQIDLNRSIKTLGLFDVDVALHPEVKVKVQINIARSQEEAEMQLERGGALIGTAAEREEEEEAERLLAEAEAVFEEEEQAKQLAAEAAAEGEEAADAEGPDGSETKDGDPA